jgi:hypothetical protein
MKNKKKYKEILGTTFIKQDIYSIIKEYIFNKKLIEILG